MNNQIIHECTECRKVSIDKKTWYEPFADNPNRSSTLCPECLLIVRERMLKQIEEFEKCNE